MRTMLFRAALAATALLPALALGQDQAFDLEPGTRVLAPLTWKQLAVFPVVKSAGAVDSTRYLSLAEGLARKQVRVTELESGGAVNRVRVANRSKLPLLLLGGEVILGGQQDRVIGKDSIIAPQQDATVEVFCVEHGRWTGRREFVEVGGLAEGKIRVQAKYNRDQDRVWGAVAEKNAALEAQSATGTYRNLAAGAAGKRAVQPYQAAITQALVKHPHADTMVGVIAAINGRVVSVDLFRTPALFASHRDHLLDSIYITAADAPVPSAAPPPPPASAIKAFVDGAERETAEVVSEVGATRTVEKKGRDVLESQVEDKTSSPGQGAVYKSVQRRE